MSKNVSVHNTTTTTMVHKIKQKSAIEEEQHQEICLDGAVEIKEEDELIIEDIADADHVRWCFIGLDDNEEDEQEFCPLIPDHSSSERQITSLSLSYEDVIEITDDEDADVYDSLHNFENGNDSGEIGVSNEPLHDSYITDDGDTAFDVNPSVREEGVDVQEDGSCQKDCGKDYPTEEEPDNDTKEFIDEHSTPTRRHRRNKMVVNNSSDNEEGLIVSALKDLISRKYIKIKCHLCNEVFSFGIYTWLRHMREQHDGFHSKMLSIYSFHTENLATCKLCKAKINSKVNMLIHCILQHSEITPKVFLCSVCNYADTSVFALQEHQKEKHLVDEEEKHEECPKCHEGFKNTLSVEYHFQASHSREFWGKFRYGCHLCADHPKFDGNKNNYFNHLIIEHKLNNWKILKFRKFDVGRRLQCTECLKIFTNAEDLPKLLGHYLTHQVYCFWSCKFCEVTHRFNEWPALHMCTAMKEHFGGKNKDGEDNKASIQKLISWNEFEVYVKHVCPFCMEEFDKFEDWRMHIREIHYIHTLEGLNMSIIPHDPEKLQCLQCLAPVVKSAVELHKHRFQHLPYQPYKCRHCSKSLTTYNLALNHVLTRCEDQVKQCTSKVQNYKLKTQTTECSSLLDGKVNGLIAISCPLCNNKRFSDFEEISKHFRNVHDNFQQYFTKVSKDRKRKCKICQYEMSKNTISVTVAHYLQHLHDKPFKCRKCQRSYPVLKRAKNHVIKYHSADLAATENAHKQIKTEKDVDSGKTRKSVQKEKEVKKEKNVELSKSQKSIKKENDVEATKFQKLIKSEKDLSAENAKNPIKREQKEVEKATKSMKLEEEVDREPKSAIRLDDGSKVFKEFEQFITYACPECNASIASVQQWENHIQTQHTFFHPSNLCVVDAKDGSIKCKDCNLILPDFVSSQRRHKLSHMGHRSFICSLCLVRFSHIGAVYVHMRKTHFAKCRSKCPLCPKKISTPYEKSQHMKQSHSRTAWPNDICLMCFQTVPNMDKHIRLHHVSRPKYGCGVCGVCFTLQKGLEQHMATKHSRLNGKPHKDNDKGCKTSPTVKRQLRHTSSPSERQHYNMAKRHCT